MRYETRLVRTARTVGYVEFEPEEGVGLMDAFEYLGRCPMDTFMHRFALGEMAHVEPSRARKLASSERAGANPAMASVLAEAARNYPKFAKLSSKLGDPANLAPHSPLVDLRVAQVEDRETHREWMKLFRRNIERHKPLPGPDETGLSPPREVLERRPRGPLVEEVLEAAGRVESPEPGVSPKDTAKRAVAALQRVGLRAEAEKRHQASLAPVGLLREWLMETSVRNGRLDYELSGMQTAYGRGLDLASARAAYLMEIVERRSAWARVADMRCLGHAVEHELVRARLSELVAQGREALDPGSLPWEAPYEDQALHWLTAEEVRDEGVRAVLVPAQLVFLLLNLDEQDLYSGYGSTGLAAGNTMAGARLAGLMEIIERDAEAVTPYHPSLCFRLEADDPETAEVLADYGEKGVDVAFQDLTTEFGVPCYKAFAIAPSGKVAKGAAASLSGPRAALSALTEVPFAYPGGPKSQNAPGDLPVKKLEDLPDFSSGTEVSDLEVVEKTLMAHGYHPLYVDLTMERMNMPVVRAMAPGLEHAADFDESARVSPRLFENYLKHYA